MPAFTSVRQGKSIPMRWICWMFIGVGLSAATGCSLINPYVKSPGARNSVACRNIGNDGVIKSNNAFAFAQCVRDDMDDRAGKYASLNNGGSAFLLALAGLTTYRAFRGGNDANVQALATGGATLFAAQKYLYRKPREVIYATGSATIDCGIGITMRRVEIGKQSLDEKVARAANALAMARQERRTAANFEVLPGPNSACPVSTHQAWRDAKAQLASTDETSMSDLEQRIAMIRVRLNRIISGAGLAWVDLITLTKNVRGIVNRQLALEQPDPAEIAASIAVLKLPSLETASVATTPANGGVTGDATGAPAMGPADVENERRQSCKLEEAQVARFAAAARAFQTHLQDTSIRIRALEAHLSLVESGGGAATDAAQLQKICSFHHLNAAAPFDINPAETPQKLTAGKRVLVPIEGGVSPFVVNPAVSPKDGTLTTSVKALEDGGYAFEVTASVNATPGTYLIVSNDDAGASRSFQVQVVAASDKESVP